MYYKKIIKGSCSGITYIFGKDKSIGQMLSSFNSNSYEQLDGQNRMEISVFDEILFLVKFFDNGLTHII